MNNSFGFSIRGGQEFSIPLYILKVAENGPAAQDGRMQVKISFLDGFFLRFVTFSNFFQSGDQIIEINGHAAHGMTHSQAISLIRSSGLHVRLLLKKTHAPPPSLDGKKNNETLKTKKKRLFLVFRNEIGDGTRNRTRDQSSTNKYSDINSVFFCNQIDNFFLFAFVLDFVRQTFFF